MILAEEAAQAIPPGDFFFSCSGGKHDELKTILEEHPNWANARTENGETCLHLAGIQGFPQVTKLLLEHGADPNVRSTYEQVRDDARGIDSSFGRHRNTPSFHHS